MRIAQIMLAKGFGGAERSFVDTALSLASRGHSVLAICHCDFSEIQRFDNVENLRVETVAAGGEWDFWTPRKIARILREFEAGVVHTQLKRAAWHGGRGAHLAGVPCVSKLHNYVKLARYKYVHTLLCTTLDQRRHVLESGWPEARVAVIPNFSRLEPVTSVPIRESGPLRILSYGRYVPKKGFDLLLRAFRSLLDSGCDATLTIGGQGDELTALQKLADELGIADRVELGLWIDDVSSALDQADLFVLSSLDEPFGIVMLEAMARGVPIVSTRTKGPLEVLSHDSATLVEPGSADALYEGMRFAIADWEAARARAGNALELYQSNYYEPAVIARIEAVYRELGAGN